MDILVIVTRNLRGVEGRECSAIVFTFVENGLPIESCLCTLQYEKLEQDPVVMHWDAPFFIMVLNHKWAVAVGRPLTSLSPSFLQIVSIATIAWIRPLNPRGFQPVGLRCLTRIITGEQM